MSDDAEEFQVEDVEGIVKTSLQSSISQESRYDPETANTTSRTLLETCIKNLAGLGKPFKYIVTAIIMQKNGAGLHTAMGAYWDARKDGASRVGQRGSGCWRQPFAAAGGSVAPRFLPQQALSHTPRTPHTLRPLTRTHATRRRRARALAGTAKVSWENETMHIVVTVYGVATAPSPQQSD